MRFNRLVLPEPVARDVESAAAARVVVSGSNDYYGAHSIEHFSGASGLTCTHEDAQGFLDYPTSFAGKGANFWLKDAGVKVWGYEEKFDNWQDTYGMDAVMVFYHSGHGNMDRNGVFQVPLGAKWDERDWAFSNNMAFANEAVHRLNTERLFSKNAVAKGWYQWQWIGTLPTRSFSYSTKVQKNLNALILDDKIFDDERLCDMAQKVGVPKSGARTIKFDEDGNRMISSRNIKLHVNREGALNICFGKANVENTSLLDERKALKIAQALISDLDFDEGVELKPGHIRHRLTCGGTMKGSGKIEEPAVIETIVQFRQCQKGVESVNSDHGLVAVCIDNDGSIINIYNSTKAILGESDKPRSIIPSPPEKAETRAAEAQVQFDRAIGGLLSRRSNAKAGAADETRVLAEKIGYDFSGRLGLVVRQRDVELAVDDNLRKRYKIRIRAMG